MASQAMLANAAFASTSCSPAAARTSAAPPSSFIKSGKTIPGSWQGCTQLSGRVYSEANVNRRIEGRLVVRSLAQDVLLEQASGAVALEEDAPAAAAPSKQKIRIKLRSYWTHLIQQACVQILEAAKNTNSQTMGPVPLPTKRRIYCVLRSPHVDKDSREHFEIRTHHRLIDLMNPNAQTIDALMQLDLPAGVDVEVKLS